MTIRELFGPKENAPVGVRFTRPVRPYGAGDTVLLPAAAARAVVDAGDGELCELPEAPHAHEAGYRPPVTKPMQPAAAGRQGYLTKKGR